jgi:aspartate kinase
MAFVTPAVFLRMVVLKFGGAALTSAESFANVGAIVSGYLDQPIVVVLSALALATRELEQAALVAQKGQLQPAIEQVAALGSRHKRLVEQLFVDKGEQQRIIDVLDQILQTAYTCIQGVCITRQLTPRTLDKILAVGEALAQSIGCAAIQAMLPSTPVVSIPASHGIVTDAMFGAATPHRAKTAQALQQYIQPKLAVGSVVCMQGFVGVTESGETSTMGKESSSLTASIVAAELGATEVVLYTNVRGLHSADPQRVPHTQNRPRVSYRQAHQCADKGLQLLFPTMITPVEQRGIPIRIAHMQFPTEANTVIHFDAPQQWFVLHKDGHRPESQSIAMLGIPFHIVVQGIHQLTPQVQDVLEVSTSLSEQIVELSVPGELALTILQHFHAYFCANEH